MKVRVQVPSSIAIIYNLFNIYTILSTHKNFLCRHPIKRITLNEKYAN